MTLIEMRNAAIVQQRLTDNKHTGVAFVVPGKWGSGKKCLLGRRGPKGDCVNDMGDRVLCMFDAELVREYLNRVIAGSK